jgi:hypothetical protein
MKVQETILSYCADLLSESKNEHLVRELFSCPPGHWHRVATLAERCQVPLPPPRGPGKDLDVTWLEHPGLESGFVIILFFSQSKLFSNAGVYNRAWLLKSSERQGCQVEVG